MCALLAWLKELGCPVYPDAHGADREHAAFVKATLKPDGLLTSATCAKAFLLTLMNQLEMQATGIGRAVAMKISLVQMEDRMVAITMQVITASLDQAQTIRTETD